MRPAQERFVFFVTKILAGHTAAARRSPGCLHAGSMVIARLLYAGHTAAAWLSHVGCKANAGSHTAAAKRTLAVTRRQHAIHKRLLRS